MALFSDPKADEIASDIASGMPRDQVLAKHADYFNVPPAGAEMPIRSSLQAGPALSPADIQGMNDADANAKMRAALMPPGPIAHETPVAAPMPQEAARVPATPMGFQPSRPAEAPAVPPGRPAGAASPHALLGLKEPAKPNALAQELAKYGSEGDHADEYLAAQGGYQGEPSAEARGATPIGESREIAPVKLGALDIADREHALDEQYRAEADAVQAEEDARRMARWGERVGEKKAQEIQKNALLEDQARSAKFQQLMTEHQNLAKEVNSMSITEPTLWTGNTGRDLLKGIGLVLMGIADPKAMQQEINTQIDRNLEVQKQKIGKKRNDLADSGLLLNQVAKQYDDEATQTAAAKTIALQGVANEVKHFAEFSEDPAVKARAEAALAGLQLQQQEADVHFQSTLADHVQRSYRYIPKGAGALDPIAALKREKEYRDLLGQKPEFFVPQAQGYATNKESAEALRKAGAEKDALNADIAKMADVAARFQSAKIPRSEAEKQFAAARASAQLHFKNRDQLRLGESTESLFNELLPKVSITDPNAPAAWNQVRESLATDYGAQARNHGIVNGQAPINYRSTSAPKLTPEGKGAEE